MKDRVQEVEEIYAHFLSSSTSHCQGDRMTSATLTLAVILNENHKHLVSHAKHLENNENDHPEHQET